jgi:hypothetical protein
VIVLEMGSKRQLMYEGDVDVFSQAEPCCCFAETTGGTECCYRVQEPRCPEEVAFLIVVYVID